MDVVTFLLGKGNKAVKKDFESWFENKDMERRKELESRYKEKYDSERYYFQYDEKGYLSKYRVAEYRNGKIEKGYWDGHYFKVYVKRKADWKLDMFHKKLSGKDPSN